MRHKLSGTGIAIVTPFLEGGEVDFIGLEKILNHIIEGSVDYIVVLGTTRFQQWISFRLSSIYIWTK